MSELQKYHVKGELIPVDPRYVRLIEVYMSEDADAVRSADQSQIALLKRKVEDLNAALLGAQTRLARSEAALRTIASNKTRHMEINHAFCVKTAIDALAAADGKQQEDPKVDRPKVDCAKCSGYGWLRGRALDNPDQDTYADTMTKYPCDGDAHKQQDGGES